MSNIDRIINKMKEGYYLRMDKDATELVSLNEIQKRERINDLTEKPYISEKFKVFETEKIQVTFQQLHDMRYQIIKRAKKENLTVYSYLARGGRHLSTLLLIDGEEYYRQRGNRVYVDKLWNFDLEFNKENFHKLFKEATVGAGAYSPFLGYAPFFKRQLDLKKEKDKKKTKEIKQKREISQ